MNRITKPQYDEIKNEEVDTIIFKVSELGENQTRGLWTSGSNYYRAVKEIQQAAKHGEIGVIFKHGLGAFIHGIESNGHGFITLKELMNVIKNN
jgi:hypothetical protein